MQPHYFESKYEERKAFLYKNFTATPQSLLCSSEEFEKRLSQARNRIFHVVRFLDSRSGAIRGTNHSIEGLSGDTADLANFIDNYDDRRRRAKVRQDRYKSIDPERKIKSPQKIARRRSAIFSGADVTIGYLQREYPNTYISKKTLEIFIDLMRMRIIEEAIRQMVSNHELEYIENCWYIPVTVMDEYRKSIGCSSRHPGHVKNDDRSFHGRPNRDRGKVPA